MRPAPMRTHKHQPTPQENARTRGPTKTPQNHPQHPPKKAKTKTKTKKCTHPWPHDDVPLRDEQRRVDLGQGHQRRLRLPRGSGRRRLLPIPVPIPSQQQPPPQPIPIPIIPLHPDHVIVRPSVLLALALFFLHPRQQRHLLFGLIGGGRGETASRLD